VQGDEATTDKGHDLQAKVNGLQLLTETLTHERVAAKAKIAMMLDYLKSIDKLDAYQKSDVDGSLKKNLTFEQALDQAMEHAKDNPSATKVHVTDSQELESLERQVRANHMLAEKVWDELQGYQKQIRQMAAYLKSIDKLTEYKKWAEVQADKQQAAAQKKRAKEDQAEASRARKKMAAEEAHHQKLVNQQRQDRLERMREDFRLKQERIWADAKVNTARYGGPHGGWGDPYDEVDHPDWR
jgi:hypothetical protein